MVAIPKDSKRYLVQSPPDGFDPTSEHIQIFDNYIAEEGLHLRKSRDPHTDERWCFLMRTINGDEQESLPISLSEYPHFQLFRERELRFNRYLIDRRVYDLFLGALRGIVICYSIAEPPLQVKEITNDPFYSGPNLQTLSVEDIQKRLGQ